MKRYRKKPVVIEAVQWDGTAAGAVPIINWILEHGGSATYHCDGEPPACEHERHVIRIHTLEGDMDAVADDWIIEGVQGEHYPCKPDIFAETYEVAP